VNYRAKIDWWIALAFLSVFVLPLSGAVLKHSIPTFAIPLLPALLLLLFLYPQWYETAPDALLIRAGLKTWRVPYAEITAVRSSPDSRVWGAWSLALSIDRISVEYRGRTLLISPRDQVTFFEDLASRAPRLEKRGQDLVVPII
jgi:hypothetical protein